MAMMMMTATKTTTATVTVARQNNQVNDYLRSLLNRQLRRRRCCCCCGCRRVKAHPLSLRTIRTHALAFTYSCFVALLDVPYLHCIE